MADRDTKMANWEFENHSFVVARKHTGIVAAAISKACSACLVRNTSDGKAAFTPPIGLSYQMNECMKKFCREHGIRFSIIKW